MGAYPLPASFTSKAPPREVSCDHCGLWWSPHDGDHKAVADALLRHVKLYHWNKPKKTRKAKR